MKHFIALLLYLFSVVTVSAQNVSNQLTVYCKSCESMYTSSGYSDVVNFTIQNNSDYLIQVLAVKVIDEATGSTISYENKSSYFVSINGSNDFTVTNTNSNYQFFTHSWIIQIFYMHTNDGKIYTKTVIRDKSYWSSGTALDDYGTSSVNSLVVGSPEEVARYSVNGVKGQDVKGVNIIRYKDGTVRKVVER